MSTAEKLSGSLKNVLSHDPWYGPSTFDILESIPFEQAYEKPPGAIHSIAGILLHMLAWTLEVAERINGKAAGEPTGGDWPDPGMPDEQKWQQLINDFKLANVSLDGVIQNIPPQKWDEPSKDLREPALGTGVSYQALIEGLIQHHIYHSGQIALMKRISAGG